jgi:hypothetical protein
MLYKLLTIPKEYCNNQLLLLKYLYSHNYDDVININENMSISYYTINNSTNFKIFYARTNLCAEQSFTNISKIRVEDFDDIDDNIIYKYDEYNIYITYKENPNILSKIDFNKMEKLDEDTFIKLCIFLLNWFGEYGDLIFKIKEDNTNWIIEYRFEK